MNFRKDINGLRAIAALSVFLFHFKRSYIPGGFLGVDIFFVVSGFLMTSIIFRGIDGNNFSLVKFYYARVKRIIPALTVVVFIVLVIGYFICTPIIYKTLGMQGLSSLLFFSNFITQNDIKNYVNISSPYSFLGHLWTLSIEWQFYIIYPIIVVCLVRIFSRKVAKYSVPLMLIASFIYFIYLYNVNSLYGHFSTFSRIWQILAGAMVYLFPIYFFNKRPATFEILGILLVLLSLYFINGITVYSFIPVLGACLVILANNPNSMLRFSLIQTIGLCSYSIYLIHLPFILITRIVNLQLNIIVYLLIVFLFSFIMYTFIEKNKIFGYKLLTCYILTVALTGFIYLYR